MKNQSNEKIAMKVSFVTIGGNLFLSIFKLFAGIVAHSGAMVSDAVHSASDVFSTFVVMAGVHMSNKVADKEHPYGHERMECVAAIILSVVLFATGLGIGYAGILKIFHGDLDKIVVPGKLALAAAVISIMSKEVMYWYTRAAAKKIHSGALMADAWHHRSDALSSIGSLIGILGARMGFPVMDCIASVVICLFVLKAAVDIFLDSTRKMVDKACDEKIINEIAEVIREQEGVLGIDKINTRLFGDRFYIDVEISANGNSTLLETHAIAQQVHDTIEERFLAVKHCMVHVNPAEEDPEIIEE